MSEKTFCRAQNPEFCRYHGSTQRSSYQERIENHFNDLKNVVANSTDVEERHYAEADLRDISVEYAATDNGHAYYSELIKNSEDWSEQERYTQILEDGQRFREMMENQEEGYVTFPASKLPEAIKRIEKANRKLARAGLDERFTYTTEEYIRHDEDGYAYQMIKLGLSHPKLNIQGWDFVASVDRTVTGDMITRVLPSQELNGYRPEEFRCDHCGSIRRRNSTYLVRNEKGEYKQVGSNCLESFLGVKPHGLWALNYDLEPNNDYIYRGRLDTTDRLIPTASVVATALAVSDGGNSYRSTSYAQTSGVTSTATAVRSQLFGRLRTEDRVDSSSYMKKAQELLNNTEFEGNSDYATNMRTLLNQPYTTYKHIGYVTSVIAAAQRQQRNQERATIPRARGYIAQPGETIRNVNVKVKKVHHTTGVINGHDIDKTLLILSDEEGREIKWTATGYREYNTDDLLVLKSAAVVAHSEFNGNEQTVITRGRIIEV